MILDKYDRTQFSATVNFMKIPCNQVDLEEYNKVVRWLNKRYEKGKIKRGFTWTKSGGLCIDHNVIYTQFNNYEVKSSTSMHEVVIMTEINDVQYVTRIQYRHGTVKNNPLEVSGRRAFVTLRKELRKDNINIEDYKIDNGEEVKKTIPKPLIGVKNKMIFGLTFEHCYHLDLNSAYPAAMGDLYPEWKPTLNRLYNRRHRSPVYKAVLNEAYGFMQSKWVKYQYSHISKYCIEKTIERLKINEEILEKNGCIVLGFNTDGIWFQCENSKIMLELEQAKCSKELGSMKLDHKDCKMRYKSDGAYEYIENGKYTPVVRGATNLDDYKDRKDWEWGDIYKAVEKRFVMSCDEYGVILEDNKEGDLF